MPSFGCSEIISAVPRLAVSALLTWSIFVADIVALNYYRSFALCFLVTFLYLYCMATYNLTWIRGPGFVYNVPGFYIGREPLPTDVPPISDAVTAKHDGRMRFCSKCKCWKPDRAHHCSSCKACVLRMDHHCPWYAICIGFRNHKNFIQFLVVVTLYGGLCALLSGYAVYALAMDPTNKHVFPLSWMFLAIIGGIFGVSVGFFAAYTVYNLLNNQTTIEALESVRYRSQVSSNPEFYRFAELPTSRTVGNLFDIGYKNNWRETMGTRLCDWFVPWDTCRGNGTSFPVDTSLLQVLKQRSAADQQRVNLMHEQWQHQRNLVKADRQSIMSAAAEQDPFIHNVPEANPSIM
ncbi:hypothetical protein CANCADRAFT_147618 [Tortispora caseinolytica NRRL Y-17796]|uniref:Palmitoyltransferase n=1 Tax=Tortispora caseinolytica NRRL Y-17796 TaxID=767744 RepID=A0A1E4TLG0_9ASCO|nr:hypothetical protein CANCADRAFT_147618 [Tortispora caseinolytica NRRL Y-17796]